MAIYVEWRQSVSLTGTVVKWLAVAMVVPLLTGLVYGEDTLVFVASMAVAVAVGWGLEQVDDSDDLGTREALLFVALAWFAVSVVGAVPYVLAGWMDPAPSTLAHPVNALFESTSGFTTTGATVAGEISFDRHSHALLIWRQLTQWLGGMGIIVLMIAILPEAAVNGAQLMDSEAPGPRLQKLTPRIAETARVLWLVYLAFTVLYVLLLLLLHYGGLAPEMNVYSAIAHAFTTLPTGGFSPQAESIAYFSPVVQWLVIPFMLVAGVNFALFWHLLNRDVDLFFGDPEFRAYLGANVVISVVLFVLLFLGAAPTLEIGGTTAGNLENALRQAAFQVASLLNSTGYATSDFAKWDAGSQIVLLFAMFVGGSAGSTGGGVKVVRWLVVMKVLRRELFTAAHPEAVTPIRLGKHVIDEDAVRGVLGFTLLYLVLYVVGTVFLALDASRVGLAITPLEATSASLATLGNIGPGFGFLGPFGSYVSFPATSKLFMVFLMLVGRLEIIPVLALFTGGFWRR
ncbi:trk system potassium uptake protein TrkH [Halomicrobium zhouii]|uniref:Trk system potassium uptake protein TrkH n=1 Tax=Halomicrobium zhouii TaxID=767519 RepID=A0A1I6KS44_9EURY|nr:TrkH family potassium uptake protein [Halomicrobium zhouii]SFR94021.1 trk system potassium uptake protein TrkH [Halomicrobium zhouii]